MAAPSTAADGEPLLWWQRGLAAPHAETRLLRTRLAIARGRKHCQVRLVIRILAQPSAPPPPPPPTAAERRALRVLRSLEHAQSELTATCARQPTAAALARWSAAAAAAAAAIANANGMLVDMAAPPELAARIRSRLFPLAQAALQTGPLHAAQPARFKRLKRDGLRRGDWQVQAKRFTDATHRSDPKRSRAHPTPSAPC